MTESLNVKGRQSHNLKNKNVVSIRFKNQFAINVVCKRIRWYKPVVTGLHSMNLNGIEQQLCNSFIESDEWFPRGHFVKSYLTA